MSILTFLCIASVVYLCAADPIGEAAASSDQERVDKFMAAVANAYDADITPLLGDLSEDDRDYMKVVTLDGVGSFVNFCIYRALQENQEAPINEKLDDDDVILQFDSPDSFAPAVAYKQPPVVA